MSKKLRFTALCALLLCGTLAARAQTSVDSAAPAAASSSQAPDDLLKRLADLVHAGKYAEAQQTVDGLLVLYPDDARLHKAQALLQRAPVAGAGATPGPAADAPAASEARLSAAASAAPPNPAMAAPSSQPALAGMDRVDYNALIELARQAQQSADVTAQRTLAQRFLDQSGAFVQKHPDVMTIWQLRAAMAIAAPAPMAGYEAGQKVVALGAVDSGDAAALSLLGQLKNLGWMDPAAAAVADRKAQAAKQFAWMLGDWIVSNPYNDRTHHAEVTQPTPDTFEMWGTKDGARTEQILRGRALPTGEIAWEWDYYNPSGVKDWPTGWQPITIKEIGVDQKTFTLIEPSTRKRPWTYFLRRSDVAAPDPGAHARRK